MSSNFRKESESATELAAHEQVQSWPGGFAAPDALGVHTNQVRRYIRSFDDARRSDIANERLPSQFDYNGAPGVVPVPSMRMPGRGGVENMQVRIRRALEEGIGDGGVVERLADHISRDTRETFDALRWAVDSEGSSAED